MTIRHRNDTGMSSTRYLPGEYWPVVFGGCSDAPEDMAFMTYLHTALAEGFTPSDVIEDLKIRLQSLQEYLVIVNPEDRGRRVYAD